MDTTREHELEAVIVDVMDGWARWWEIQERTGVSQERAKEIAEIVREVFQTYVERNTGGTFPIEGDA